MAGRGAASALDHNPWFIIKAGTSAAIALAPSPNGINIYGCVAQQSAYQGTTNWIMNQTLYANSYQNISVDIDLNKRTCFLDALASLRDAWHIQNGWIFGKFPGGGSFSIQKFILQCLSRFYTPGDGDKYLPWLQIQFQVKLRLWSFLKMGSWCVTGRSGYPNTDIATRMLCNRRGWD